jgi:hypothetical protein
LKRKTEGHTTKVKQYQSRNKIGSISSFVKVLQPDADRKVYDEEVNMVNAMTSCGLVAEGLNSNLIERIFNQSLLFDSIKFLNGNNKSFSTEYAMKTNLVTGCNNLDNEIKKLLHNEPREHSNFVPKRTQSQNCPKDFWSKFILK